ncbi:response regulator [Pseudomonas sp. ABC1]|uniref:response regulator n=1 Tax=Pseudomonas sp. ABC1 TaxID=2748080 RepID=UPI0015C37990|nr:response regulator [Pseudomonas sp. ABC1]QLF93621.1 response regulator [Pseudomonas sp. ABC1]
MPLKSFSLLLVEDSRHDAELALLMLERHGLDVRTTLVHDHRGAERELQQGSFDLIICDYLLPGSSGTQALEVAQRLAPKTPLIFLSGVLGEQHAVEVVRRGAVDYVLKQNLDFLPKAVTRALAEQHERRQRQRAEAALQEVELRAQLAIDAARLGMWDYLPQSGRLLWDERCRALYELSSEAPVDFDYFLQRCLNEDLAMLRHKIDRALQGEGHEYHAEYRIRLEDGGLRWLSSRGRAFFEAGECVRFTGVLQDITREKLASEALQKLNDRLGERVERRTRERDRTWELSRDLLCVMRLDTCPININPAWTATLGYAPEALLNRPLLDLIHPDDQTAILCEIEGLARGQISQRFVSRMRDAQGEYHWLSWTVVPDAGLLYGVARDITSERGVMEALATTNQRLLEQIEERERVEATLQQMQRLEAVGQLTAGVAHDFNNLLTVILTSTSFLARDLERGSLEKSQARLQNIREAGERGAKLTTQLLAFSRRQRLVPETVNLNDTLSEMLALLQSTLGGSILIETCVAPGLWPALIDPTQTELIILNLAINARDAMVVGGRLRLLTSNERVESPPLRAEEPEPGDYVVLSVVDSGSGMSDEVRARAFEPFFTTKEVGRGSGLGLAQVFGFAKQSGGGVRIATELGQGTTVKVYLPRMKGPLPARVPVAPSAPRQQGDECSSTILLVDDDARVREVTAAMLRNLGYRVRETHSGSAALACIDGQVDLLLADFAMPGMSGAELAEIVRQRYPALPIVFISGYAELGALRAEGTIIVQKPFRDDEIERKLRQALGRS